MVWVVQVGLPPVSRSHSCLTRAKALRKAGASALEGLGRGPGRTWWVGCEGESAPPIVSLASGPCHCEERVCPGNEGVRVGRAGRLSAVGLQAGGGWLESEQC